MWRWASWASLLQGASTECARIKHYQGWYLYVTAIQNQIYQYSLLDQPSLIPSVTISIHTRSSSCHSQLIISIGRDISNPRQRLISAPLDDLQIPHLYSRNRKVRDLELDADGLLPRRVHGPSPASACSAASLPVRILPGDARQTEVRAHQVLPSPVELLDGPDHAILVGEVCHVSHAALEAGTVHVGRDRDGYLHTVGDAAGFKLGSGLDHVLDTGSAVGFHNGLDPYQRLDVRVQSIRHEIELAVRWDEGYGPIVLEPREADALVEFDVLELDGLALGLSRPAGGLKHELVVQTQLELRHAREEGSHLHGAVDFAVEDGPVGGHEEVELLDDVQKNLVLLVLDALGAPAYRVR
mmetsp:Transcript_238/g.554  ORF Transcript_238/g.554 Transcript_238/m.554 type:complete len:355 (+) Transcript_238:196-1260(+)